MVPATMRKAKALIGSNRELADKANPVTDQGQILKALVMRNAQRPQSTSRHRSAARRLSQLRKGK